MTLLHGFDISAYQSAVWTTPTDMLFVKATEGTTFTSSHFVSQFNSAKKLARVHGAYHFARPGASTASAQADHFLSVVGPYMDAETLLVLDLETSQLSQSGTNQFARDFAARLGARYPTHRRVLYMGGGYSSTGTGAGLSQHYHLWWYPRYRSTANTGTWPTSFNPDAPTGKTGWSRPDIWQWTDNFGSSHIDANVSDRSVAYLLGSQEDDLPYTEAQLRKFIHEEVHAAVYEDDVLPAPGSNPGDPFDPANPGFDPAANPTWAGRSVAKQTVQGLLAVDAKVDALAAKVDALSAGGGVVDVDALAAKVAEKAADLIAARLES